jgi:RHS repeat-associated protein
MTAVSGVTMNRLSAALTMLLLALLLVGPAAAGDTVYYYSSDTLHSEVVITDAGRNVVERTYYAPYGQVLNRVLRDGPGYAGHEEDPESSLVYMEQRYFDPESGRFLSSDPVATTDNGAAFNRYAYANGSPYRYTDPTGAEGVGNEWLAQTLNMGNATDTGPLSRSDMIEAGSFIGGFIPVLSEGLAIKGFADHPSWLSAGIMAASIFDLGGVAKGLGKAMGRGPAAEAGTATISEYATAAGSHFSIDVAVGNESLATEQLIVDGVGNTSIGVNASTGAVRTWTMTLPDGQAALGFSRGLIGTDTGVYNSLTNSCLSYCGNVLNAGGLNVPLNSTLGTIRFLRGLGQ